MDASSHKLTFFQGLPASVILFHAKKHFLKIQDSDCIGWSGQKLANGSGLVALDNQRIAVRRFLFAAFGIGRPLERNEFVKSTCNRIDCCNPDHLTLFGNSIGKDTDSLIDKTVELYRDGFSLNAIAKELQVSRSWVEKLLAQARRDKKLLPVEAEGVTLSPSEIEYYTSQGYHIA